MLDRTVTYFDINAVGALLCWLMVVIATAYPARSRAAARLSSRRAVRRTDAPPSAKMRAIPAPIVPAPTTATSRGKFTRAG